MSKTSYYTTLGINEKASAAEIKSAYRKMAQQHHPDKNPGDKNAEAKFKQVSEAYETLSDENKRAAYDRYGHDSYQQQSQGGGGGGYSNASAEDLFRNFMGGGGDSIFDSFFGGGGRESRSGAERGASKRASLTISFLEAVTGVEKEILITRNVTCTGCKGSGAARPDAIKKCTTCRGSGQVTVSQGFFTMAQPCHRCGGAGSTISEACTSCAGHGEVKTKEKVTLKIPAGIDSGMRLRMAGKGDAGTQGGPAGDLHVSITVDPHEFFEREGDNILCDLPISFTDAALGGKQEVAAPSGKKFTIEIPEGVQNLKILTIPKEGFPNVHGHGRGELLIRINVETPVDLSDNQKKLLREFQKNETEHNSPRKRKFINKIKSFFNL